MYSLALNSISIFYHAEHACLNTEIWVRILFFSEGNNERDQGFWWKVKAHMYLLFNKIFTMTTKAYVIKSFFIYKMKHTGIKVK